MSIGNKHEVILTETITQLESDGYKIIRTNNKSPTCIAFNDNESVAISIQAKKNKTITFLEDMYHMYDRIDRIILKTRNRKDVIDETIKKYKNNGYNIFYLNKKCPDAIAIRNGNVYAVEVLGRQKGYSLIKEVNNKTDLYDMFDGVMFKTFIYGSDDVFTETFGNKRGEL